MLPVETSYIQPRNWPIFIPLAFSAVLLLVSRNSDNAYYINLLSVSLLAFSILLWVVFKKRMIIIDDKGLTYKTMFFTREIVWQDVIKTYIRYKHYGKSGKHIWYLVSRAGKDLYFATSFYSRQSLKIIADAVTTKCPEAQIQDKIVKMSQGTFPWYIF